MFDGFTWLNEPKSWSVEDDRLRLATGAKTDFWRSTFYGFERDSGHAFLRGIEGDFSASASFTGAYETLYDQAGMMLRIDAETWIKAGIEYTDGLMHFSVVVTAGRSDWSVIPLPEATPSDRIRVRLTRHGDAVRVQYGVEDGPWRMARLCPFPAASAQVGITACSPEREGFRAAFSDVTIGPAIDRRLHDD